MIDDKLRAEIEHNKAFIIEVLPNTWWGLYSNCIEEGFSEEQALELIKEYIMSKGQ